MPREYICSPQAKKRWGIPALGFRVMVPDSVELIRIAPGSDLAFHAVEKRPGGRFLGEMRISIVNAAMIMDRGGVLQELAGNAAAELLTPPAKGQLMQTWDLELPAGEACRADVRLTRDGELRSPPPCPYLSALAVGHPDFMIPAALFVLIARAEETWPAGDDLLQSLEFKA